MSGAVRKERAAVGCSEAVVFVIEREKRKKRTVEGMQVGGGGVVWWGCVGRAGMVFKESHGATLAGRVLFERAQLCVFMSETVLFGEPTARHDRLGSPTNGGTTRGRGAARRCRHNVKVAGVWHWAGGSMRAARWLYTRRPGVKRARTTHQQKQFAT